MYSIWLIKIFTTVASVTNLYVVNDFGVSYFLHSLVSIFSDFNVILFICWLQFLYCNYFCLEFISMFTYFSFFTDVPVVTSKRGCCCFLCCNSCYHFMISTFTISSFTTQPICCAFASESYFPLFSVLTTLYFVICDMIF